MHWDTKYWYLHVTSMLSELHLLLLISNVQRTKSAANCGNHSGILNMLHPNLHTSSLSLHHHTYTTNSVASRIEGLTDYSEKQRNPLILQNQLVRTNSKTLVVTKLKSINTQLPPFTLFSSSQEGQIPSYDNNGWWDGGIPWNNDSCSWLPDFWQEECCYKQPRNPLQWKNWQWASADYPIQHPP